MASRGPSSKHPGKDPLGAAPPKPIEERAARIELLVLDVDGVLTDGSLQYTADGETSKRFNARDGMGLRVLMDAGVDVAVVSARQGPVLDRRLADLRITTVCSGAQDKKTALLAVCEARGIALDRVAYCGDDWLDVPALEAVGLACTVSDAPDAIRRRAHWISTKKGGEGAVRELADFLLDVRSGLEESYQRYLQRIHRPAEPKPEGFGIIIPARYASSRLPGKPLRSLAGKPMILHVLENAKRSRADYVVVATDDERIAEVVRSAGGEALLTRADHLNGTDRLAEVVVRRGSPNDEVVVNVQGDEPLLDMALIESVARALQADPEAGIGTVVTPVTSVRELFDPNAVKVVCDARRRALYFSRAPIPWARDEFAEGPPRHLPKDVSFLRHVGIYAYRVSTLKRIAALAPAAVERAESLEQLRSLDQGIPITTVLVDEPPGHGVDTEEDVARVEAMLEARNACFELSEPQ